MDTDINYVETRKGIIIIISKWIEWIILKKKIN